MKEVILTPEWSNVARYMIIVLKDWDEDDRPMVRANFRSQLREIVDYLAATDAEGHVDVLEFAQRYGVPLR